MNRNPIDAPARLDELGQTQLNRINEHDVSTLQFHFAAVRDQRNVRFKGVLMGQNMININPSTADRDKRPNISITAFHRPTGVSQYKNYPLEPNQDGTGFVFENNQVYAMANGYDYTVDFHYHHAIGDPGQVQWTVYSLGDFGIPSYTVTRLVRPAFVQQSEQSNNGHVSIREANCSPIEYLVFDDIHT